MNFKAIWMLCVSLFSCLLLGNTVEAEKRINGIGNNFAVYDATGVDVTNSNTWYTTPQKFKITVGLYHLDPAKVSQELSAMRAAGITDIVLPIWGTNFYGSDPDGVVDWVYGERIDISLGQLRPQQKTNLINILQLIKSNGFKRVIVRFLNYWPASATTWDETQYGILWNFIYNTRNLVEAQLAGSNVSSLYDLGNEIGGIDLGQTKPYMMRLWKDYNATWGNEKTVGFSFAWYPGRFTAMKQWFLESKIGVLPKVWAFDIYPNLPPGGGWSMRDDLLNLYSEMGERNGDPIIILETYPNSDPHAPSISSDIVSVLNDPANFRNINVDGLFQWTTFTNQTVLDQLSNTQISYYRPSLANRRVEITNSNSLINSLSDENCASSSASICTVSEKWGGAPPGKILVISVKSDSNPNEVLHQCVTGTGSSVNPWIDTNNRVTFISRYLPSCTLSQAVPAAISTVYVRSAIQP